jgi:hypothetical protein
MESTMKGISSSWIIKSVFVIILIIIIPAVGIFLISRNFEWEIEWLSGIIGVLLLFISFQVMALTDRKLFEKYSIFRYRSKDRFAIATGLFGAVLFIAWCSYQQFAPKWVYMILIFPAVLIYFIIAYLLGSKELRIELLSKRHWLRKSTQLEDS